MTTTSRRGHRIVALATLLLSGAWLEGQDMPVPGDLQAPIFKKIFAYDNALRGSSEITVFFVGSEDDESSMGKLVEAFRAVGLFPAVVNTGTLEGDVAPNTVVYLMPGADTAQVAQFCAANKLLTISGVPSFAERGQVSISIGEQNQRPRIIVNMQRLKSEGHQVSADVLKLAQVIR